MLLAIRHGGQVDCGFISAPPRRTSACGHPFASYSRYAETLWSI